MNSVLMRLMTAITVAVVLPSCASIEADGDGLEAANGPSVAAGDEPPGPARVDLRALSQTPDLEVRATGYVMNEGDGWVLCEEQNESLPPSCSGHSVRLSDYQGPYDVIATESGVSWSHIPVTIVGRFAPNGAAFVPTPQK